MHGYDLKYRYVLYYYDVRRNICIWEIENENLMHSKSRVCVCARI